MITIKFRTLVLVTQIELLTEDSELALENTNTTTYIYREETQLYTILNTFIS